MFHRDPLDGLIKEPEYEVGYKVNDLAWFDVTYNVTHQYPSHDTCMLYVH